MNQCIVQKLLMGKVELQVHTERTNGTSKKLLLLLVHLPLPLHVLVEQLLALVLLSRKKIDLLALAAALVMMMMMMMKEKKKRLLLFHKPWQKKKNSVSLLTVQTLTLNSNRYNSL